MAQKPVDQRSRLNTREFLWETMLKLQTFSLSQLTRETVYHSSTVKDYLTGLVAAGIITKEMRTIRGTDIPHYIIDPETAPAEPPRVRKDGTLVTQGMGRQNMWRTMKMLKEFTIAQVAAFASTNNVTVAAAEAEYYVDYCCKAGYVTPVDDTTPRLFRFNSDRYTGPKAPMIQRVLNVYDQNLGKVVWKSSKGGAK